MTRNIFKKFFALAIVGIFAATPLYAVDIVISDKDPNMDIDNWLSAHFTNANVIAHDNYANYAANSALLESADLVIIGRTLSSADYDNGDADGYNTLTVPVVSFTSYVSREAGNRLGWHTVSASHGPSVAGDETTISAEGEAMGFGTAGPADFFADNPGDTFNGIAEAGALVGDGVILSTINGQIQSAFWDTGAAPGNPTNAGVDTFPAPRFLFNLDNDPAPEYTFNNLTPAGSNALVMGLASVGGLIPVPEPSSAFLSLAALGLLALRRRR